MEEDANGSQENSGKLFSVSSVAGKKLYRRGDFAESQIANLDVYLSKKVQKVIKLHHTVNTLHELLCFIISSQVGLFPDVLERRVLRHLEKRDYVRPSCLANHL